MCLLATNGDQWQGSGVDGLNSDQSIIGYLGNTFKGNGPGVVPTHNLAVSASTLLNNFNKTQLALHLKASNLHVSCVKNMFILAST